MSTTVTVYASGSAFVAYTSPDTNQHDIGEKKFTDFSSSAKNRAILLKFAGVSSNYQYKGYTAQFHVYGKVTGSSAWYARVAPYSAFDPATVTYNNATKPIQPSGKSQSTPGTSSASWAVVSNFTPAASLSATYYSMWDATACDSITLYGSDSNSYKPYITFVFDDNDAVTSAEGVTPKSGWVNRLQDKTFQWKLTQAKTTITKIGQASATFRWKLSTDVSWNDVAISGSSKTYTVPAGTLPSGSIEWQVEVIDDLNRTRTTPTYTISTVDTEAFATAVAPENTIEDGSGPIELSWTVTNDSGSTHTATDIQTSTDGSTWTTLHTVSGSGLSYSVPANTFTSGTVYWRVRAYNADSVAGSWSGAVSFYVLAAPAAPVVSADGAPFLTISWQADGQQAYRITVDGETVGTFFGTAKSYTLEDYLEDGDHEVAVEVQGVYGFWSEAATLPVTILNSPGDAVTMSVVFDADAVLAWTTDSATEDFLVYRNGKRIGHTAGTTFTDRLHLGAAEYAVVNRLSDGNYTKSNTVSGTISSGKSLIALLSGGDWLEIDLTEHSQTQQVFNYSKTHSLRHISGAAWPVLELAPYEDEEATYDTAFRDAESAKPFEAMRGKPVIIKTRGGNLVVGAITMLRKVHGDFYIAFDFTVSRIHWEDFVDDP